MSSDRFQLLVHSYPPKYWLSNRPNLAKSPTQRTNTYTRKHSHVQALRPHAPMRSHNTRVRGFLLGRSNDAAALQRTGRHSRNCEAGIELYAVLHRAGASSAKIEAGEECEEGCEAVDSGT